MKTKKDNDTKKMNENEVLHATAELARLIPPTAGLVIEPGRFSIPRGPLRKLVSLGTALEAHQPATLGEMEEEAAVELHDAVDVGERKIGHDRMLEEADLRNRRLRVVSLGTAITGMLDGLAALKSPVAEKAAQTRRAMFGTETGIAKMTPLDLWMEIERVRKMAAELPPATKVLVPGELLDELFVAHEDLGRGLGMYGDAAVLSHLDNNVLILFLRRRLARWVACVLATAKEESLVSMQRALSALAPIDDLRAELARKRARNAAAAHAEEGDELDDDDELEGEEELEDDDPAPTPAAPPATGGDAAPA